MFIEMQTIIKTKINVDTFETENEVVIEAGECSVLGSAGVMRAAHGALKSAMLAFDNGITPTVTSEG